MEKDVILPDTLPYDYDDPESILKYLQTTPCEMVFCEITPSEARNLANHPDERVREAYYSVSFQWAQKVGLASMQTVVKAKRR